MNRRKALKSIGTGLSAGLILPSWLTACKDNDPQPEINFNGRVAIIGAGAAGLYAADYLLSKGVDVVIFEASDRIGGRIRSLRPIERPSPGLTITSNTKLSNDYPIELGADLIYGSNSSWSRLIKQVKIPTVALSDRSHDFYRLNNVLKVHAEAINDPEVLQLLSFLDNLSSQTGATASVEQALADAGISPELFPVAEGLLGSTYGSTNARLSMNAIVQDATTRQRDGITSLLSNNPMSDVLTAAFSRAVNRVQFNKVVKDVNYENARVVLSGTTGGNSFSEEYDKVIITVPLAVLKAGDINFTPAWPSAKTIALNNLDMDPAVRVVMDFKKNFWKRDQSEPELRYLFGGDLVPQYFNHGIGRSSGAKTLSATMYGPQAEQFKTLPANEILDALLEELDALYDGLASENIRRELIEGEEGNRVAVIQDWTNEPYIKGGISYVKPGGSNDDRAALASSLGGRVFFAGEATDSSGEAGTVNGALLSAERAALELIASIA